MDEPSRARVVGGRLIAGVLILLAVVVIAWLLIVLRRVLPDEASGSGGSLTAPTFADDQRAEVTAGPPLLIPDTLFGRSHAVRFVALSATEANAYPGLLDTFGDTIVQTSGTFAVMAAGESFTFFVMRPLRTSGQRGPTVGWWPAERWMMAVNYLNPDGFVEVLPGNVDTRLSEHFRLADFLTHDQQAVWPKYVVLEERHRQAGTRAARAA
jgi:hypothetical protein